MKESKDDKKSIQQDVHNLSESKPKLLSQIFKEMPYTDKRGKGFLQSICKIP
jgi:predicted HTH transcriptional regulator